MNKDLGVLDNRHFLKIVNAMIFLSAMASPVHLVAQASADLGITSSSIGPSSQASPAVMLRGKVIDGANGAAVVGALIRWTRGSDTELGATDDDGNYAFAISGSATTSAVTVSVQANLYLRVQRDIQGQPGETATLDFKLLRKPLDRIGTVQGHVRESRSGVGVPGVNIEIMHAGGGLTAIADVNGDYVIDNVGFAGGLEMHVFATRRPDDPRRGTEQDGAVSYPPCLIPAQKAVGSRPGCHGRELLAVARPYSDGNLPHHDLRNRACGRGGAYAGQRVTWHDVRFS